MDSIRKLEPLERELSHLIGDVTIERPTHVSVEVYRRWLEEYSEECRRRSGAVPVESGATLMLTGYAASRAHDDISVIDDDVIIPSYNGWTFSLDWCFFPIQDRGESPFSY